ncbi:hypothetical protein ACH4UM_20805 [Streptomyces sp. NPDC020801]|uniref:hypothetical protein n=1 Tax=Streptomyces sp. NPDC020801 TaxID=3365093 RepID=UPI0037873F3A
MSLEENLPAPVTQPDSVASAGFEIAMKWGAALGGPEKLEVALRALEPQLKREHQMRLRQLENQRAQAEIEATTLKEAAEREAAASKAAAESQARDAERRRKHAFRVYSLIASVVLSLSMLAAGVWTARDQPWLATALCGPSLLSLAKLFLTQRSDSTDMRAVGRAARDATTAGTPPAP